MGEEGDNNKNSNSNSWEDHVPEAISKFNSYENAFFSKIKEELLTVKDHPAAAIGLTLTAGLFLMRGPRRFLFRNTLGRFQSEEAQFLRAEKNVKEFSFSVDLMKKESRKLLERASLAEKEMKNGHTELLDTGSQIQRLAKSVYKVETKAADLMDGLREIPGRDALKLRAEASLDNSPLIIQSFDGFFLISAHNLASHSFKDLTHLLQIHYQKQVQLRIHLPPEAAPPDPTPEATLPDPLPAATAANPPLIEAAPANLPAVAALAKPPVELLVAKPPVELLVAKSPPKPLVEAKPLSGKPAPNCPDCPKVPRTDPSACCPGPICADFDQELEQLLTKQSHQRMHSYLLVKTAVKVVESESSKMQSQEEPPPFHPLLEDEARGSYFKLNVGGSGRGAVLGTSTFVVELTPLGGSGTSVLGLVKEVDFFQQEVEALFYAILTLKVRLGAEKIMDWKKVKQGRKKLMARMLKLCLIDGFVPDKNGWDTDDGMFADILVIVDEETDSDCETAGEDESFH
ncbi:hypothetical protein SADUNF_Sadunf01G0001600 [Salix dunnii]|uniref:Uncharacterized protein n=1 Tax=Salix dunnii TaxID=1413687 RepID=A0A835N978_9ROSI|nr:hypothetical protein SADUNF_Sadunf01G0001600 [Salix dunnii]